MSLLEFLTLLPLRRPSDSELQFHFDFVMSRCTAYSENVQATGFRNPEDLQQLVHDTKYSRNFLRLYADWKSYLRLRRFLSRLKRLRKSVIGLDKVSELSFER